MGAAGGANNVEGCPAVSMAADADATHRAEPPRSPVRTRSLIDWPTDAIAGALSTYFVVAACSLYWLTAGAGWIVGKILPKTMIERAPLTWLVISTVVLSFATQTVPGFFPDYSNGSEILAEVFLWLALALFARSFLVYTEYPETFEGLKASIESRPLDRLIARHLHNPIDAIFTRIWVANSIALIPLTALLIMPFTANYFVIVAISAAMLLAQFPHEIIDHTNIHTRVFQPKLGAPARVRLTLKALQIYFENVLSMLVSRTPHFYYAQHVFIHHFEGNGPCDSQTTEPYDRTSFLDFSRHAFRQGIHLVVGVPIVRYLWSSGRKKAARDLVLGLAAWYAILIVIAAFNPLAAGFLFLSRFIGGNVQSLVAFWQHGLVDPRESHNTYANTIDFSGPEHGNLGNDYHVEHHDQPGRHWSKYYELFSKRSHAEGGHPAVVFQKDMFSPLAFIAALWRKDYVTIAAMAHVKGIDAGDKAALEREIRERTSAIGLDARTGIAARIDDIWSRLMALAMPVRFQV